MPKVPQNNVMVALIVISQMTKNKRRINLRYLLKRLVNGIRSPYLHDKPNSCFRRVSGYHQTIKHLYRCKYVILWTLMNDQGNSFASASHHQLDGVTCHVGDALMFDSLAQRS